MRREPHLHPVIAAGLDAPLDAAEFDRRVAAPLTADELESNLELIRWFRRRYPSVKERLDYARHMYGQMTRPLEVLTSPTRMPRSRRN